MFEKLWNCDLRSWSLKKLPRLRFVTFDPKFWAEHLDFEFAIDSTIFADKQTLNSTFASAVQLVPEYVCRRGFSGNKFGNVTNLLYSEKRSLSVASII